MDRTSLGDAAREMAYRNPICTPCAHVFEWDQDCEHTWTDCSVRGWSLLRRDHYPLLQFSFWVLQAEAADRVRGSNPILVRSVPAFEAKRSACAASDCCGSGDNRRLMQTSISHCPAMQRTRAIPRCAQCRKRDVNESKAWKAWALDLDGMHGGGGTA